MSGHETKRREAESGIGKPEESFKKHWGGDQC